MDIKFGKQYINKTWRFLLPCLKVYGQDFIKVFNSVSKLAVGIHDTLLDGSTIANGRNIYILLDKKINPKKFNTFIDFIIKQDYYKGDYCPGSDLLNSRLHIIIIEIPKSFHKAYDNFLQGNYSKMYTPSELKYLFINKNRKEDLEVLNKDKKSFERFTKDIKKEFNIDIKLKEFKNVEWELPLKREEEIFNCLTGKRVFFNEKLDKVWQ